MCPIAFPLVEGERCALAFPLTGRAHLVMIIIPMLVKKQISRFYKIFATRIDYD